jgi:hypothetical protein
MDTSLTSEETGTGSFEAGATASTEGAGATAVSIAGAVAQAASNEALASRMVRRRSMKRMKKLPDDRRGA